MAPVMSSLLGRTARRRALGGLSAAVVLGIAIYISRRRRSKRRSKGKSLGSRSLMGGILKSLSEISLGTQASNQMEVDMRIIQRARLISSLAIPSVFCAESRLMVMLVTALVARTFLSVWIASINGSVVKAIVDQDLKCFLRRIGTLTLYALPASFVNSSIEFFERLLAAQVRERLTRHFVSRYLEGMVFYRMSNMDVRIPHPEQRLTADIERWSSSFAALFSNVTKPLLDVVVLSRRLADYVGPLGPAAIIGWYCLSAILLRQAAPSFGRLVAEEQRLEGDYRAVHADLVAHSEEVAFYKGNQFELHRVQQSFERAMRHVKTTLFKRLYMGCFDSLLVKYGAVLVGYTIVGLPSLTAPPDEKAFEASQITQDYVRNSSLLINLAKAIGRLVISYKEVQALAGYTHLVYELHTTLHDLKSGTYKLGTQRGLAAATMEDFGRMIPSPFIEFRNVPIVTPRGEVLLESVSFSVAQGSSLFLLGPNGCGKTSLFRVLGGLWPLRGGELYKPPSASIFYIPQRPYMPVGTLRDQIIYPDSKVDFIRKGVGDERLRELLHSVKLGHLLERCVDGWDTWSDWQDELSGGEKQRLAIARLCYHRPVFAIMDEATSAVSVDVEGALYKFCKAEGITIITVSHRMSLLKYHDHLLRFDTQGQVSCEPVTGRMQSVDSYSCLMAMGNAAGGISGDPDLSSYLPTIGRRGSHHSTASDRPKIFRHGMSPGFERSDSHRSLLASSSSSASLSLLPPILSHIAPTITSESGLGIASSTSLGRHDAHHVAWGSSSSDWAPSTRGNLESIPHHGAIYQAHHTLIVHDDANHPLKTVSSPHLFPSAAPL